MMENVDAGLIKDINRWLEDDLSKDIFMNRLMYSFTGDKKYIRGIVCNNEAYGSVLKKLETITGPVGIFGAALQGRYLLQTFDNVDFVCFIDNYKAGTVYEKLPVVSLQEFQETYPDAYVVISVKKAHKEILEQLCKAGYSQNRIINLGKAKDEAKICQYFDLPQLKEWISGGEVFVDGGSYNGHDSIRFAQLCQDTQRGYLERAYAWEPDPVNLKQCNDKLKESGIEYTLINKGMWSETGSIQFVETDPGSSYVAEDGYEPLIGTKAEDKVISVEVGSIDDLIPSKVTFIKMDIEGAEYRAILGARKTIERDKPKLAICLYHKPEDIWQIPALLHEINPDYRFWLRHYSLAEYETVLYAL